jgi:DNA polymerase III gamma/tau subunit
MRHIMKPFKKPIDEGLATDITSQMLYCLFVDVYSLATKKGGLMTIMFPNVGAKKLYRWLGDFPMSQTFSSNSDKLKQISQRFGGNSTLKTLFRVINTLKTKETEQEKNDARINDIQLVMSKIERVVKSKLTPEENQLFTLISSELEDAADNAGKSIEGSVGASTKTPEPVAQPTEPEPKTTQEPSKPAEEPVEKPEEKPAPEKPEEKPAPEKPEEKPAPEKPEEKPAGETEEKPEEEEESDKKEKKESISYEQYEKHIKSLVKEIVRKKLGL